MTRLPALILIQLVAFSTVGYSQGITGLSSELGRSSINRGYFNYTQPGDITISVNVWGNVRYPGLYVLKEGTDLKEVISYCGSSQENTLLSTRRTRDTIIQLSRENAGGTREIIYERDIREIVNASDIPTMQEADVVMIQVIETERFYWRDLLPIASLGVATTNLILNVIRLNN